MSQVCDLVKNQEVYLANVGQTVVELVKAMVERNIGAVPILHESRLVGIFSERDLMKRVVGERRDPAKTWVEDVMTKEPLTVAPNEDVEACMVLMRRHGFRHLPICDGDRLIGMVSLRDIMLHHLDEKDHEMRQMRAYIHSTPDM